MGKRLIRALAFSAVALTGVVVGKAQATDWPMYCVGPLDVRIDVTPEGQSFARVHFSDPHKAGGNFQLQPGQCSWPDRPFSGGEAKNECAVFHDKGTGLVEYTLQSNGTLSPSISRFDLGPKLLALTQRGTRAKIYMKEWGNYRCGWISSFDIVSEPLGGAK